MLLASSGANRVGNAASQCDREANVRAGFLSSTSIVSTLVSALLLTTAAPVAADEPAGPPEPMTDEYDWMQFNNGEWLKGEIVDLQDDGLVFESDELDELQLDWDDVAVLYSSKLNTVTFRDKTSVEGTVEIKGDEVRITTEDGVVTASREEVRSIIPGRQTELNYWSGKLSVGATVRRGNVDQTDLSGSVNVQRRDAWSRLTLEYAGAFSKVDGETTADNHRALANYDIYATDRLFVRPIRFVYYRDRFQNIDYRLTPSGGLGYDVIDKDGLTWTVGAGAGWEYTKFDEAAPGEPAETDFFVLLASTRAEWEATSKVDFGLEYDITIPAEQTNAFNFRAVAYTEVDLGNDLDLDVKLIWDRVNDPAPLADGSTPDEDDLRVYVGIGWSF